jgi:hypothetical protein
MNELTHATVSIALAIVGVAILAVLVSKNANTSQVLGSAGSAFAGALAAAEGPVTGQQFGGLGTTLMGPGF